MTRMILAVPGKPFVLPYANDASWHLVGLVLFATEFLVATLPAFGPWLALSIGRPMCVLYLSVCNISESIAVYFNLTCCNFNQYNQKYYDIT